MANEKLPSNDIMVLRRTNPSRASANTTLHRERGATCRHERLIIDYDEARCPDCDTVWKEQS
jgi:hypothetical protein